MMMYESIWVFDGADAGADGRLGFTRTRMRSRAHALTC